MAKCIALTAKNTQCNFSQMTNCLCTLHNKMRNKGKNIRTIPDPDAQNKNKNIVPLATGTLVRVPIQQDQIDQVNDANSMQIATISENNTMDNIECICCYGTYQPDMLIGCTGSNPCTGPGVPETIGTGPLVPETIGTGTNPCITSVAPPDPDPLNHRICRTCMRAYIAMIINDKKKIQCVFDNKCNGHYRDRDIEAALDDKLLARFKDYRAVDQATRLARLLDNYHVCPFCSKYGIIIENVPGYQIHHIKNLQCQYENCGMVWCIECRKAYHGTDPCNKINTLNKEMIRRTIDETIDAATIHNCPKCFTKYNKEDGCNLMTCPSCETHSCYLCNMLIEPKNGLKYWHFKPVGSSSKTQCPLYNTSEKSNENNITKGNINLNNRKIIDALKILIKINETNPEITNCIKENLFKRGYVQFKPSKNIKKKTIKTMPG
jgi:hypothetical protein